MSHKRVNKNKKQSPSQSNGEAIANSNLPAFELQSPTFQLKNEGHPNNPNSKNNTIQYKENKSAKANTADTSLETFQLKPDPLFESDGHGDGCGCEGCQGVQMKIKPFQMKSCHDEEEYQFKESQNQGDKKKESFTQDKLPDDVMSKMEGSFNTDFSDINIYENSTKAENIGALAFTQGSDIHFAPGQYSPNSQSGQELIGHELTHSIQQKEGKVSPTTQKKGVNVNDDDSLEQEADLMGLKASKGQIAKEPTENAKSTNHTSQLKSAHNEGCDCEACSGRVQMKKNTTAKSNNAVIQAYFGPVSPHLGQLVSIKEAVKNVNLERRKLKDSYIDKVFMSLSDYPEIQKMVQKTIKTMNEDQVSTDHTWLLNVTARTIYTQLIKTFIHDPETSTLDLLRDDLSKEYKELKWEKHDYPGGTTGKNERKAKNMAGFLKELVPERRANSKEHAVFTERQYDKNKKIQKFVTGNLEKIPDFSDTENYCFEDEQYKQKGRKKLNKYALASFIKMRRAAAKDGVPLVVLSAYRSIEKARAKAAAANNKEAVASFSSHSLGLAIDIKMGVNKKKFKETKTRPMQNVIDMRTSSAHKWMFMHASEYGWFPYTNEPWHWEYNPVGLKEKFMGIINSDKKKKKTT